MGTTSSDTNDVSQSGRIVIKTNKTAYIPGDKISGKIYIQTFSPLPPSELLLHLHGMEASYIFHDDDSGKPGIAEREIVNSTWTLYQWKTGISSQHIEIPFSFDLPRDIPPSFHQEEPAFIAHITYKLEAFVKSQGSNNDSKTISRIQKLVIRCPEQRTPKSHAEEKKIKVKTLGCIPKGSVTLKAHFEKDVYSQREEARVVVEVDNELGKLKNTEICFQLTQKVQLNHKWGGKTFYLAVAKSSIPGAAARSGPVAKSLTLAIPHFIQDYHNYDRKVILRDREILGKTVTSSGLGLTTKGKIISSEFYLEVYCTMKGANATVPRIRCPVDIRYPDPKTYLLNLPADWNPEVLPKFEEKKGR